MPIEVNTPKRRISQAPVKFTVCHRGCGAVVEYRTTPRVFCPPCKVVALREKRRATSERTRRKNGIAVIKGTEIACGNCGALFVRSGIRARLCETCKVEVPRERARKTSASRVGIPGAFRAQTIWAREKRRTSPRHAINSRVRYAIWRVLSGGKGGRKWEALVGYKLADLMRHLERQFVRGMTWKNRGSWHIDHIVPISSFKFESPDDEEFRAAWALTNLRPLWSRDNIVKNATRTHLL